MTPLRDRVAALEERVTRLERNLRRRAPALSDMRGQQGQRRVEVAVIISHTVIAIALITAAVVLAVTGNDATPVWAALAAYGIGASVQKVTGK